MVPPLIACESAKVINVSHKEHSPITSSPYGITPTTAQHLGNERIQDSMEDKVHGVQAPFQHMDDYIDDDLYAVSPQGKAALDAARATVKEGRERAKHVPRVDLSVKQLQSAMTGSSRRAVERSLANGGTAQAAEVDKDHAQTKPGPVTKHGR